MANGSHKKALASNIIFLSTLLKVLLFTAFFHALYRFLYHSSTVSIWLLLGFTMNSGVSALIYSQLRSMGLSGVELSAKGMVGYVPLSFDVSGIKELIVLCGDSFFFSQVYDRYCLYQHFCFGSNSSGLRLVLVDL